MSRGTDKNIKRAAKGSDDYRLVVYRSDDFQEVRSFNLSLSSIYILTSVVLLLLCGMLYSLLAFTPLKKLIPGYGKIETNQQFLQLVDGVDMLSDQIEAQGVYIAALRNFLGTGLSASNAGELPDFDTNTYSIKETNPINPIRSTNLEAGPNMPETNFSLVAEKEFYKAFREKKIVHPVNGLISSEFDPNIKHYGVDILAPARTPIIAMMDGFVFNSGWDLETGYTIGIQHDSNILSFYKHNSQLLKEKGTFVRAGEAIAIIGNTGTLSNGPHLHFEIWHNGQPVNPQDILKFN